MSCYQLLSRAKFLQSTISMPCLKFYSCSSDHLSKRLITQPRRASRILSTISTCKNQEANYEWNYCSLHKRLACMLQPTEPSHSSDNAVVWLARPSHVKRFTCDNAGGPQTVISVGGRFFVFFGRFVNNNQCILEARQQPFNRLLIIIWMETFCVNYYTNSAQATPSYRHALHLILCGESPNNYIFYSCSIIKIALCRGKSMI